MTEIISNIAQVNITRMLAPLDDPIMSGFVARLVEINALADSSPGFVWRLKAENNSTTYLRPYDDDRLLFTLSVWESIEHLTQFVYFSQHSELIRQRKEWFSKFDVAYLALWWVPTGHHPTIDEANERLEYLRTHGECEYVFSFKRSFTASGEEMQRGERH